MFVCGLHWSHCTVQRNNRVKFDKMYRNFDGSSEKQVLSVFLSFSLFPPAMHILFIMNSLHIYIYFHALRRQYARIYLFALQVLHVIRFLVLFCSLHLSFSLLAALSPFFSQTNAENAHCAHTNTQMN